MSTLQINLSEPLQRFVAGRVAELGLDRVDQYFEQLIEEERRKRLEDYYLEECQKGLASGPSILITPDYWDKFKEGIRQRYEERRRNRSNNEGVQ